MTAPPVIKGQFDASSVAGSTQLSSDSGEWDIWGVPKDVWNESLVIGSRKAKHKELVPTRTRIPGTNIYQDIGDTSKTFTTTEPVKESIGNLLKDLAGKATGTAQERKEYQATQRKLFEAGLYGTDKPAKVRWGAWDNDTKNAILKAYQAVAQQSSVNSVVTLADYLNQTAQSNVQATNEFGDTNKYGLNPDQNGPAGGLGGSGTSNATVNQFTDPNQIMATAQQAAQSALGRNLSDKEVKAFLGEFQKAQQSYNTQANAAQAATDGTYNLTQPDLGADAQGYIQQHNGTEIAGQNMAGYVNALQQLLGVK